jgi:hypothetical protein
LEFLIIKELGMTEVLDTVKIGESEYQVIKTGRAQAAQVLQITRWASKHGVKAFKTLQANQVDTANGIEFLGMFIDALDVDALIDLFQALTGCTKEEAELYFDISVLLDVLFDVYERQPAVKRVLDRFFSISSSPTVSDESSTTSE